MVTLGAQAAALSTVQAMMAGELSSRDFRLTGRLLGDAHTTFAFAFSARRLPYSLADGHSHCNRCGSSAGMTHRSGIEREKDQSHTFMQMRSCTDLVISGSMSKVVE